MWQQYSCHYIAVGWPWSVTVQTPVRSLTVRSPPCGKSRFHLNHLHWKGLDRKARSLVRKSHFICNRKQKLCTFNAARNVIYYSAQIFSVFVFAALSVSLCHFVFQLSHQQTHFIRFRGHSVFTELVFQLQISFAFAKSKKKKRQIVFVQPAQHFKTRVFRGTISYKWVQLSCSYVLVLYIILFRFYHHIYTCNISST